MEKDEVVEFLQNKVDEIREKEPYATQTIEAFEHVIGSLMNE